MLDSIVVYSQLACLIILRVLRSSLPVVLFAISLWPYCAVHSLVVLSFIMPSTTSHSLTVLSLFFAIFLVASEAKHVHHHHVKRALSLPNDLPTGWSYLGCYTDSTGARTLPAATYNGNAMTDESCVSYCANLQYPYAGTEYGGQCYCGTSIASTGTVATGTDCNVSLVCSEALRHVSIYFDAVHVS